LYKTPENVSRREARREEEKRIYHEPRIFDTTQTNTNTNSGKISNYKFVDVHGVRG